MSWQITVACDGVRDPQVDRCVRYFRIDGRYPAKVHQQVQSRILAEGWEIRPGSMLCPECKSKAKPKRGSRGTS